MRGILLHLFCLTILIPAFAQVGVNTDTPNPRAVLDLRSPTNNQGLLVPRLSRAQRTASAFTSLLAETENGLLVFDTDDKLFYYWMYPEWRAVGVDDEGTAWHSGVASPDDGIGKEGDFI